MLKDHKTDVAAFQQESDNGKDSDVKEFAAQTAHTGEHLKQAESVTGKIEQASKTPEGAAQK
jgi:hypothetical protein